VILATQAVRHARRKLLELGARMALGGASDVPAGRGPSPVWNGIADSSSGARSDWFGVGSTGLRYWLVRDTAVTAGAEAVMAARR